MPNVKTKITIIALETGFVQQTVLLVPNEGCVIGRGGAALNLSDPKCSRMHAIIWQENGTLYLKDLGSKNGTFVGSDRVEHQVLLEGQCIQVGGTKILLEKVDIEPEAEFVIEYAGSPY